MSDGCSEPGHSASTSTLVLGPVLQLPFAINPVATLFAALSLPLLGDILGKKDFTPAKFTLVKLPGYSLYSSVSPSKFPAHYHCGENNQSRK